MTPEPAYYPSWLPIPRLEEFIVRRTLELMLSRLITGEGEHDKEVGGN